MRALAFISLALLLSLLAGGLRALLGHDESSPPEVLVPRDLLLSGLARFLPLALATVAAARLLDLRPARSVGLEPRAPAGRQIGLGLAAGAAVPLLVAAILAALGHLRFEAAGPALSWGVVATLLGFLFSGVFEELLLRGYLLQNLCVPLGPVPAVLLTAAAFGLLHGGNPDVTAFGQASIIAIGVLLGWLAVRTASIWAACAFHVAWNATGSAVLGMTVSGFRPGASLLVARTDGPSWLTGGAFGYEASALTFVLFVIVLGAAVAMSGPGMRHERLTPYYRRGWAGEPEAVETTGYRPAPPAP